MLGYYTALFFLRVFDAQKQLCLWFNIACRGVTIRVYACSFFNKSGETATQLVSFFEKVSTQHGLHACFNDLLGAKSSFPFRLAPDACFSALEAESMFSRAWSSTAASYFPTLENGCVFLMLQLFLMLVHCICTVKPPVIK